MADATEPSPELQTQEPLAQTPAPENGPRIEEISKLRASLPERLANLKAPLEAYLMELQETLRDQAGDAEAAMEVDSFRRTFTQQLEEAADKVSNLITAELGFLKDDGASEDEGGTAPRDSKSSDDAERRRWELSQSQAPESSTRPSARGCC